MTMTIDAQAVAPAGALLEPETVQQTLHAGLSGRLDGARVLVLIPDHTRTIPLPALFPWLVEALHGVQRLDFMVALGTHPPLSEDALNRLVGITADQRRTTYAHIGLFNHAWDDPAALAQIGTLPREQVQAIAGDLWHPSLGGDVPVRLNRQALSYDHLLIVGPTFPHEVVGFSGGAKYLFPGISGAEMINVTHWLGALMTILNTIGIQATPVRTLIQAAAALVPVPVTLVSLVVVAQGAVKDGLAGLFVGDLQAAWRAAADLSSQRHMVWLSQPLRRVLSCPPPMYDELWTAAKAMYKLEPAVADGGEIIVYAPHLTTISHVHGHHIAAAGYHVRDYYLKQWERFAHIPPGVLAHGTHLRGSGTYDHGVERARIQVTLATGIPRDVCERLSLGYCDPASIDPADWQGREAEGVLYVPRAGEMLYRVRGV
ncbi:MAG: lactate racemase domain-containing protein [Anaerolineae bacterium]|jgi:nickel-dependent lactate racemase|nr:lactate racemase domain-containing protein [Anaerolineae bacterium]